MGSKRVRRRKRREKRGQERVRGGEWREGEDQDEELRHTMNVLVNHFKDFQFYPKGNEGALESIKGIFILEKSH